MLELSEREGRKETTFSSDLLYVVPTYSKLLKIYNALESAGYIQVSSDKYGSNRKLISLTVEGKLFLYGLEATSSMVEVYTSQCVEEKNFLDENGLENIYNPDEFTTEPMTVEERDAMIKHLELKFEAMRSALLDIRLLKLGLIDDLDYTKRKMASPMERYHYFHEKDVLTPEEQERVKEISKSPSSIDKECSHESDKTRGIIKPKEAQ